MSIHAKLSPEARILLRKQERKSRVLSAIIACLGILLVAGVLALFAIPMMIVDTPTIVTYSAQPNEDREIQQRKVVKQTSRKPAAPA
jgi:predicted PurR-regulated permease PerM